MMARYNKNKNNKRNPLIYIMAFAIICLAGGAMLLWNMGLVVRSEKIVDSGRMELPLSHSVVNVRADSLEVWVTMSECIAYKSGKFYPKDRKSDEFRRIVNRNGLAERMAEYHEDFEWEYDEESGECSFEVPTIKESRTTYVSVPTWIIYDIVK